MNNTLFLVSELTRHLFTISQTANSEPSQIEVVVPDALFREIRKALDKEPWFYAAHTFPTDRVNVNGITIRNKSS